MDYPSSAPVRDGGAVGRPAILAGTVGLAIAGFLYRFLTIEFLNDHFVHLSRGYQIVRGEVPVRDFFDPGLIGQYYASAAALLWSGHNLYGEAILTTTFVGLGAGLTFLAAARLTGSAWIASITAILAILSTPRLYGYPKVFFYVLAVVGAWSYVRRPGTRSIVVLAVITAVAFLFRHDHGVYIALAVVTLLAILYYDQPRRALIELMRYGAIMIVLLAPFLIFIQTTTGLRQYVGGIAPQIDRATSVQFNSLPIVIDRSAPLLTVSPPADRRVNVRWAEGVDDESRVRLEAQHGLLKPEHVEGSTWSYVLANEDREPLARLVDDPAVADTHGIDRAARKVDISEPLFVRLQRWIPLLRTDIAPGIFTRDNALACYYYVTFALPFIGLGMLAWVAWQGTATRAEMAVAGMTTVLCLIIVQTLVRGSPDSRIADVANPIFVVGAWVSARTIRASSLKARPQRLAAKTVVYAATLLTLWSVVANARALTGIETAGVLRGPMAMFGRMEVVSGRLHTRPIDNWGPNDPGLQGLGRYVFECTQPTDRVFVTWFDPQIFFYTERMFAGGQVYLTANWHSSVADQQLTIERLKRQRVPVVLERVDSGYSVRFPLVYKYIQEHYQVAPMTSDGMKAFRVLVDRSVTPTGTYETLNLPCFH
jgi:hypothetical protein